MRWLAVAVLVVTVLAALPAEAARKALVIGNAAYTARPLANPVNDATDMAARLGELGFAVTLKTDATRADLVAAVLAFQRGLAAGDEAVVFYAGHGVQVRGVNYMMPVDLDPQSEVEVEVNAVSVDFVRGVLAGANVGAALVLLDACRDNPYAARFRGGARGLARVERTASGTLISYAAAPGTVASDGRGRNSPYTTAWLAALAEPGLTHHRILDRVYQAVKRATGGQQETYMEGQLSGELVLNVAAAAPVTPAAATQAAAAPVPAYDPRLAEVEFWRSVERGGKEADYRAYLAQYPNGQFAVLAQGRLADLKPSPVPPTVVAAPPVEVEERDAAMVTSASANVRATPASGGEKLETLSAGTKVTVTGKAKGLDWLRIERPGGGAGWVFASLLADPAATVAAAPLPAVASPPVPARPPGGTAAGTKFRDCADCPEMIWIPPGEFTQGSPTGEAGREANEDPQRRVRIGAPLAVGVYEVTFAEWDACVAGGGCNGYRPNDQGWGRGNRPVIIVNWTDAQTYVAWLSRKTGQRYRLLSESEWEYAARAGTTTRFSCGDGDGCLASVAWHDKNAGGQTRPVGGLGANAFGLHDMHGNVWEWVEDCWNDSYAGAPTDGGAWTAGECGRRVVRGGSWDNDPRGLRVAFRFRSVSGNRYVNIGFRVVR